MTVKPARSWLTTALLAVLAAVGAPASAQVQNAQLPNPRVTNTQPPNAQVPYKIVTASERGTYIQIGRDIAKYVAPAAGIDLEVLPSAGSSENVRRLRHEAGVKFALVQSDVYQAYIDSDRAGNTDAGVLIRPLRVIMPLYNEEIYFVVRADSPMQYIDDMQDAKINVGPLLSGTALTATTLYRLLFKGPIVEANASYLTNEEALVKLTVDKTVDVVAVVAGQPAKLLVDMKPEARALIRLLKFDANRRESQDVLQTYFAATIRQASYPNLLTEDVAGLAVKAYLVTYDYALGATTAQLRQFGRSLCRNFASLQTSGHPKWREVDMGLPPLGRGWSYYAPVARELQSCSVPKPAMAASSAASACGQQDRILGLCR
jgi:uncharacterized protein